MEGVNYRQGGPRISKSFFPPEESKSTILRGYYGVIEPVIYIHFCIGPEAHVEAHNHM